MHRKRGRGRGRANGEGAEHDSLLQPCCIEGCDRYGTRLLSSLRDNYQLKDSHSGRVCEGHYRRDLRSFKRKHSLPTPKKSTSPVHSSRKHQMSSSSPPNVMDEPLYDHGIPHSYLYEKSFYQVPPRSNWINSPPHLYAEPQPTSYPSSDEYEPPSLRSHTASQPSQIFMEVDEYEDLDEEDDTDEMTVEEPAQKKPKTVLPSISQLYSTPSPSTLYQPSFDTYYPPPIQVPHQCGLEPLAQPPHDTKFKAFCDFVLKNESWVI